MAHRLSRMASTLLTVLASAGSVMPAEAGRFLCRERQIGMLPRGVTPPPPVYVDADSMQDAMEKARPSFSGQYFCIPPAPTREEHAAEVARLNKAVAATAPKTCPAPTDTQASYRYSAPLAAATSSDCDVALEPDEQLFLAGFLTEGDGACNWGLLAQGRSTYLFGAQAVASGGGTLVAAHGIGIAGFAADVPVLGEVFGGLDHPADHPEAFSRLAHQAASGEPIVQREVTGTYALANVG